MRALWSRGPAALLEEGFTPDGLRSFLAREDVSTELHFLDEEFKHQRAIEARTLYIARRNVRRLHEGAAAVMARALMGEQYARDPNNNIMRDARGFPILKEAAPTQLQQRAAEAVLAAIGMEDRKTAADAQVGDLKIRVMIEAADEAPEILHDPDHTTEFERALARERVRIAIEKLAIKLPEVRTRVNSVLGVEAPKAEAPKQVKKVAKKKTIRKATKKP